MLPITTVSTSGNVSPSARTRTSRRVEQLLVERLPDGNVGIDEVASHLGMSRQTLFRRLRCEGTTFTSVLDELRQRMALQHLGAGKPVNETAYFLGFADPAAFSRAFRRWTGTSPRKRKLF